MRRLSRWIAWRYLKSKKSHGAVSAIAIVSIAGVAIATAAVVCVLSVFNGFREVLTEKFDTLSPDIVITTAKGKVIENPDSVTTVLNGIDGIISVMPVVSDKALAIYEGKEMPVTLKGVDPKQMVAQTKITSSILKGGKMPDPYYEEMPEFEYYEDYEEYLANTPLPEILPSIMTSVKMGNIIPGDHLILFAPRREGRYNPANPAASFVADSVSVSGIFETKQREYDEDMVIVPIGLARHLFQYEDQATSLELKLNPNFSAADVKTQIASALGDRFIVRDRAEMHEMNFRMINIEKWVSFLLLVFILMIAGFNIISTMTMLVLEKRKQMSVMNAIGMRKGLISGIFRQESLMVSFIGGIIGIGLGVLLCWLQQEYGLVKLSGSPATLLMREYPVRLVLTDVLIAFVPCVILGLITAAIAGAFARSRVTAVASE